MYTLVLDESGTHAGAPVVLVAGIAIHEADVQRLETDIHKVLDRHVSPLGHDPYEFEAHAAELKTPGRHRPATASRSARPASPWLAIDAQVRLAVVDDVYDAITSFEPGSNDFPVRVFGAIVDRRNKTQPKAERIAYEHVLHRFDEMLTAMSADTGTEQRGIVLHDRRDGYDRTIQELAAKWQRATGTSRITRLVHVPVFADSRASRLIQAADFISYAMWRHYTRSETLHVARIWPLVGRGPANELTGVIHRCPGFAAKTCLCEPCLSRY